MTDSIDARVERARAELETTLNELEDKFNVPKRVQACSTKARASMRRDPMAWVAAASSAAVIIGGAIAAAIIVSNRRS